MFLKTESPYKILEEDMKSRGIGKNLGVDPKIWYGEVEKIEKSLGPDTCTITAAGDILDLTRSIKSDWELEQMRKASEYSANGILNAIERIETNTTEIELMKVVQDEMSYLSGNPASFALVQFGDNSAIPHGYPTNRKLKNNEAKEQQDQ